MRTPPAADRARGGLRLGLLGDVMLGRRVGADIRAGLPPAELWSPELRELCGSLDLVIANLECCLSERGDPTGLIEGKPFFFRGPPRAVEALTALNVRVASMANNHALDFGRPAASDTAAALRGAGIAVVGGGGDRATARRPAIVDVDGARVGVVAVCDHPPQYAAGDPGWGTAYAPLRTDGPPEWLLDTVHDLRSRCDLVVAFPHWGPNKTLRPARWRRELGARLQQAGADVVAGHSAHLFHGVGWGVRGPLLYDLGGAVDDYRLDEERRNDLGLLAIWRVGEPRPLELVGLRIRRRRTEIARGRDARWITTRLTRACARLGTRVQPGDEGRWWVLPRG